MRRIFPLLVFICNVCMAQHRATENLIIVTLDGLRWQEVFTGADSSLIFDKEYSKGEYVKEAYWSSDYQQRRSALLPFFWNTIGVHGQLYGNRNVENKVNCANLKWFSYPGYSELLVGFVEPKVKSNDAIENPNYTVLEYIENQPGFSGKVAVYGTWENISFATREATSGISANTGTELATGTLSERQQQVNELQSLIKNPHGARYDAFTFYQAFEYLKVAHPRVLFISFDETDEYAHAGRYEDYLQAAHNTDEMLRRLWSWIQSAPGYKDKTTLLITTDHGRGKSENGKWKNHGLLQYGSGNIWMAVMGPDTPPLGEVKKPMKLFQKQLAKTAAAFLGIDYTNVEEVGEVIDSMMIKEKTSEPEVFTAAGKE